MGEFGKSGELGETGKLGTESGAERRTRFFAWERGSGYARYACAEVDFWEEGHAGGGVGERHDREGNLGERHDRRTVSTRQKEKASLRRVRSAQPARAREPKHTPKRKSKFATCAERPARLSQRTKAHVKKKKQVCDVCGAPISPTSENKSTRQKEKASLRRVRSAHLARAREQKYTPKRKNKF